MTECPQPHYFHYDCWNHYIHAEETRTGRRQFLRVPCPVCRHLQMSEAEVMLSRGDTPPGCFICLREQQVNPFVVRCGHRFCEYCITRRAKASVDAGANADCPLCRHTLLDENILVSYLFTRKIGGAAGGLPQLAEDVIARVRSGFLSRVELARFCLDETSHILLAPEPGQQLAESDNLIDSLIAWSSLTKLPQILHHCKMMKEWNAHLGANHLCPMCMQPVGEGGTFQMDCVPIPHRCHTNCWNYQPEHMKPFCRVCSQQSLGEMELLAVGGLFGFEELKSNIDAFPPVGRQILERFVTGAVLERALFKWCFAPHTRMALGQTPYDDDGGV